MKYLLPTLLVCTLGLCIRAQDVVFNTAFGKNGLVIKSPEKKDNAFSEWATSVIELPDQKFLVAIHVNGTTFLTRHLQDGSQDKTYGEDGFSEPVKAALARAVRRKDGKIMAIGIGSDVGTTHFAAALYDENGKLDAGFGNKGVKIIPFQQSYIELKTLLLQQDDKLLLAGTMDQVNGQTGFVMRLTADATPDASFANGGLLTINVPGVTRLSDLVINGTKILVGATINNSGGSDFGLLQYLETGYPDPQFGKNGLATVNLNILDNLQAITMQPDGKIIAAGGSSGSFAGQNFTLFRLLPSGQLDDTFNGTGAATVNFGVYVSHFVRSITIDENGSITLAGYLQGAITGLAFANFTSSGNLNQNYGDNGKKFLSSEQTALDIGGGTLLKDGSLIGAGLYFFFGGPNANVDYLLAKVTANGQPDAAFGNNGLKTGYYPGKNSFLSPPKLFRGGDLLCRYFASGTEQKEGLVRLRPDGIQDQNFGELGLLKTPAYIYDLLPDGRIVTFDFGYDPSANIVGLFMNRYTSEGKADLTLGANGRKLVLSTPGGGGTFNGFIVQPDGRILLTGTTYSSGSPQQGFLTRLNADGKIDRQFGHEGKALFDIDKREYPLEPVVQPDGGILVKGIAFGSPGYPYHFIRRFDPEGKLDESFGNKGMIRMEKPGPINKLFIRPDDKLVLTVAFHDENQVTTNMLLQYNPDGTPDTEFGEKGGLRIPNTAAALLKNGKMLLNNTDALTTGNSNVALMLLNADGSIDTSFGTNGTKFFLLGDSNNVLGELSIQNDHVYIVGSRNTGLDREGLLANFRILDDLPGDTALTSFTLVNASTGKAIQELRNGDVLDLAMLPRARFNIRANTNPSKVGSVVFELKGPHSHTQTENLLPYALFGDDMKGRYYGAQLSAGEYTLTATPYSGARGGGTKATPLTIHFKVIYSATVPGFTLVNADTDKDLMPLKDGDIINLAALPSLKINIRANASPGVVGSMVFDLSGAQVRKHTENNRPYALFANNKSNYYAWTPMVGSYTLIATPHSATRGGGEKGAAQTIHFNVVYQPVQSVTLVDASSGKDVRELNEGDVIDLSKLADMPLNIRANTGTARVGSVDFELQGPTTHKQTENILPYALFGDDKKGRYYGSLLPAGKYTLTATPYSGAKGTGIKGKEFTIHFEIHSTVPATCDEPSFGQGVSTIGIGRAHFLSTGDFNGDGKMDAAIILHEGSRVGILIGKGDGSFAAPVFYASGGNGTSGITAADFNKDDKLDLMVSNSGYYAHIKSTVGILLGNGDGSFASPKVFFTGSHGAGALTCGDFNGDEKLDVGVINTSTTTVSILLGKGNGSFGAATLFPSGQMGPTSITVGDFNGDKKLDVAIPSSSFGTVGVLLGKGDGNFDLPTNFAGGGSTPLAITTGDFNGDKVPDLAVSNYFSPKVGVLLGDGTGGFKPVVTYVVGKDNGNTEITTGDFNNDQKMDLAIANYAYSKIGVMFGKGDGSFGNAVMFPSGNEPFSVVSSDFTGDGTIDMATAGFGGVVVLPNICKAEVLSALTKSRQQSFELAVSEKPEASLGAYPNPFSSQSTVRFSVAKSGYANLSMYDSRGVEVARLYQGRMEAGKDYQSSIEAKNLPTGVYLLRLTTENETKTAKVVLVR